ncbi:MAG: dTDP-4-dehydrorhamnose 3,5-epimerase family protein [Mycoplasma sp.]
MNELKNKNSNFKIIPTKFEGLFIIDIFSREDNRGSFEKDFNKTISEKFNLDLKEIFYTKSKKGVIRAHHFQAIKHQLKYVRCLSGRVFDVVIDIRKNSKTYKQIFTIELSGESNRGILIPHGFSHGYLVIEDAIVSYKCDEYFYEEGDMGFKWNDDNIKVEWPLNMVEKIILSEKDENSPSFNEIEEVINREFCYHS